MVPKIKWLDNQSLWQRLNSFYGTLQRYVSVISSDPAAKFHNSWPYIYSSDPEYSLAKPVLKNLKYKGIEFLLQTLIFHYLYLSNPIFYTFNISNYDNSIRSNLNLKYQRFTSSDWKDIGIKKFLCVAKTQFLLFTINISEIKNVGR